VAGACGSSRPRFHRTSTSSGAPSIAAKVGVTNPVTMPNGSRPLDAIGSTSCTRSPTLNMLTSEYGGLPAPDHRADASSVTLVQVSFLPARLSPRRRRGGGSRTPRTSSGRDAAGPRARPRSRVGRGHPRSRGHLDAAALCPLGRRATSPCAGGARRLTQGRRASGSVSAPGGLDALALRRGGTPVPPRSQRVSGDGGEQSQREAAIFGLTADIRGEHADSAALSVGAHEAELLTDDRRPAAAPPRRRQNPGS
jgi:hypothetical protein